MDRSKPASETPSAQLDKELAARAVRKLMERKEPTKAERAALARHEKEKEERLRWQHYASIPQKHWREMSGRQTKVLNEQAARYGIPFGGATIDLAAVIKAFHDFLAENAQKLARDDDELLQGGSSPALERYREERAELAKMDRLERQDQLIPRALMRQTFSRVAVVLRTAGESLERQYGAGAADLLREALDDAEREAQRFLGDEDAA